MKIGLLSATIIASLTLSAQVAQSELIPASKKSAYLDINNVEALVTNGSYLWNNSTYAAPYKIKEFNRILVGSGAIWLGGKTLGGDLSFAGTKYNNDVEFYAGPYSTSGTQTDFQKYDRVWKLTRAEVLEFTQRYNDPTYIIPEVILTWPAHGDETLGQAKYLAPFYDKDGNGIYNPLNGDYPEFDFNNELPCDADKLYGDQVIYAIFHDAGVHNETGGEMLKAEIHLQAFAYATTDELNNTTFYRYTIYNRSEEDYNDFAFAMFLNSEIGCSGDDYVGSSEDRGLVYAFNGVENDGSDCFGTLPWQDVNPILGLDIVSSPKQKADNFSVFRRTEPESPMKDPMFADEYFTRIQSYWLDGQHYVEGGCGHPLCGGGTIETDYMFNDNIGWTEYSIGNTPNLRLSAFSVRDMEFKRNTPLTFVVAAMFEYLPLDEFQPDQMNLINKLKTTDDKIQAFADATFPYCERILSTKQIDKERLNNLQVAVYPNPSNGKGTFMVDGFNSAYTLQIFDLTGKLILSETNISTKEFNFSLENTSGYYTYKVSTENSKPVIGKILIID
jgi:hypothetical protein